MQQVRRTVQGVQRLKEGVLQTAGKDLSPGKLESVDIRLIHKSMKVKLFVS